MEWLCNIYVDSVAGNTNASTVSDSTATGLGNATDLDNTTAASISVKDEPSPEDHLTFIATKILTPSLCAFGLIGNFLNLLILVKRVSREWDFTFLLLFQETESIA